MAKPLNRPAILLNLAAFLAVIVFCVGTHAPIIQQDILKRCQDTLLIRRISTRGLSVDGRDVTLSGDAQSDILSPSVRLAVEQVNGVRTVTTRVLSGNETGEANVSIESSAVSHELPEDVQKKINRLLENQVISFKADSNALTPESELALDKIATYLAQTPGLLCEIRGYDSQASEGRQNWVLALQRALSIEDYLESKGIASWRLSARAFHAGEGTQGRKSGHSVDLVVRGKD